MSIEKFQISDSSSVYDALKKINDNHCGFVITINKNGVANGLATDGDIRRKLIEGLSLDAPIHYCANQNFVSEKIGALRENLLKRLDSRIKHLPILDSNGKLVDVITKENLPEIKQNNVYARAKAPVRISFGGGGSDLTHYFENQIGAVINSTISLFSHATLRVRLDKKIFIHSEDLNDSIAGENLNDILNKPGAFGLIQATLETIKPTFGFELFLRSDFPMKSGLGGSAAVSAVILECFNKFRIDQWNHHEIAELAFQAERLHFGISGGWQDQYATVFGGINFIEFNLNENIVYPLRIQPNILKELEASLILCHTGISHDSNKIHRDQYNQMKKNNTQNLVEKNVALTYKIRNYLLRGNLTEFGKALDEGWKIKRQLSEKISNKFINEIYNFAIDSGAIGGKILGAGGGGFFLFFAPHYKRHLVTQKLISKGLKIHPFYFESNGIESWITRDNDDI